MRILFTFLCVSILGITSFAQQHRIEIGNGDYKTSGHNDKDALLETFSVGYSYKLPKTKFRIKAKYLQASIASNIFSGRVTYAATSNPYESKSQVSEYLKQHFMDFGAEYTLYTCHQHSFAIGISGTYAWGKTQDYEMTVAGGEGYFGTKTNKTNQNFGTTFSARYDYTFLNNRINAGAQYEIKAMFDHYPTVQQYGIHIGFNF